MLRSGLFSAALLLHTVTGISGFTVTTDTKDVRVKENQGADLKCSYSGDFGANPRVEWKFKNVKGSQAYVVFDGKPTEPYRDRAVVYGSNLRLSKMTAKDNGVYDCEVSGNGQFGEVRVTVTVLVPPAVPVCRIPSSVTTGRLATLTCRDNVGSPSPKYKWYRNDVPLPMDPHKISGFQNFSYSLNPDKGELMFSKITKMDSGDYYCEAFNDAGPPQRCRSMKMDVRDVNTGGIVAGVIVALLLLALLGFGIWYANKKGYLPRKSESKPKPNVVYQPQSSYAEEEDGDFKQKSSFLV
ncbi:F11 receptor, tandem duplicate 1 [Echeneis naucrates]|uniref:Junctional adhesion molecule A n=1 Tax=Echeneis naucrates TaxID=173247 RepID=A0A665UBP9_ECHNA|nr:junctional adhesion molecule A-like [Echeneis naucrates]